MVLSTSGFVTINNGNDNDNAARMHPTWRCKCQFWCALVMAMATLNGIQHGVVNVCGAANKHGNEDDDVSKRHPQMALPMSVGCTLAVVTTMAIQHGAAH